MLFAFLSSAGLTASLCLRPSVGVGRSATLANLGEKISAAARASASESAEMVHEAVGIINAIMLDTGNASEHMTDDDKKLLESLGEMIEESIYGSMDSSHRSDAAAIETAVGAVDQCNERIVARLGDGGDLDDLYLKVSGFQQTLDIAKTEVDLKDGLNTSAFGKLETHLMDIRSPPACEPLPTNPTKDSFDLFFEASQYVDWFERESAAYVQFRKAFEAADAALSSALLTYSISLAGRDVVYCDWRMELRDGCQAFQTCYHGSKNEYLNKLKPELEKDMNMRIDAFKACETILSNVDTLLGRFTDKSLKNGDTSRYVLSFPDAPDPEICSLTPVDSPSWQPQPSCTLPTLPDYHSHPPNSDCAKYEATLNFTEPLGNRSHTIVASVDFDGDILDAKSRVWILNVGQRGVGGHHWIFNPNQGNPVLQFGTWMWGEEISDDDPDQACQIREVDVERLATAEVIATTFDENTGEYCLFVDGQSVTCKPCGFDIQTNEVQLGLAAWTGQDMRGCIRGVDVYSSALADDEFMAAVHRLAPDANAG